ncbi:MAG: Adaptive-response sensory-kinase SasA [Phycisphaerae bacterium]|nr:Adaptive-response sensory-kinase SasA [Phycisphaerae bacterium]
MATLYVLQGPDKGRTFVTSDPTLLLGRSSEAIPLGDHSISRRHAQLNLENGQWMLVDLKSANGTYVNGVRIIHPTPMKHGDQIRMGTTLLVFGGDHDTQPLYQVSPSDLVSLDEAADGVDAAVVETLPSNEASLVLATPETQDAVLAWRIMYQLTEAIGAIVEPQALLERVMDIIFEHMRVDRGFILVRVEGQSELQPRVVRFRRPPRTPQPIATSRRIVQHVLNRCEGVLCTNAMADKRFGGEERDDSIHRYGLKSVICVPILAHGTIYGVIHLDSSVTSHTYTSEQLRLANAIGYMTGMAIENAKLVKSRLQNERLAAIGETVAFLSHYIKNVLQGLRSGADIVDVGLQRQSLETINQGWQMLERSMDKILNLSTNLLTFSKDREPNMVMAQINLVVQEAVELAQRHADHKRVQLRTDLAELPAIGVDMDGIHQVALNLVNNAIDAVPADTGEVLVRTQYEAAQDVVMLIVEDNGPGLDQQFMTEIFHPFRSTKGQGGTGLGLAAAKKIIDEHQGQLLVEPRETGGTRFRAMLPARHTGVRGSEETLASFNKG